MNFNSYEIAFGMIQIASSREWKYLHRIEIYIYNYNIIITSLPIIKSNSINATEMIFKSGFFSEYMIISFELSPYR